MFITLAVGVVCFLLSSPAARAAPHASIVEAALAGADLCSNVFLNAMDSSGPRTLDQLYEDAGWRAVDRQPAHFPEQDIGNYFGEAELAPGVTGRVVSALGSSRMGGGARCNILVLDAPGARDLLIRDLDSSEIWTSLQIGDVPNTRMYGRATASPVADIGLTILWGAAGEENRNLEAYVSVSLIPKSSIATRRFPPTRR
ncbi:MAG TPA: hypothetical protein PKY87_04640 [Terricaulis sp.]|nr:hypothetical protein [Terricaulis sp.]